MLKEDNYFEFYNFAFYQKLYQKPELYLYKLQNINLLENLDYSIFSKNAVVVWKREYNENYIYNKLENCYYFKIIPEFFLPSEIQLFIFRHLFLKHFFFLSSLYLLQIEPFRVSMRRLVLRYFYHQKLHYYFLGNNDQNFLFSIESNKIVDLNLKHLNYFNITDFLYFDFLIFVKNRGIKWFIYKKRK